MNLALRIYRRLAEAFPHEFKLAYGEELMQAGEDVLQETARRQGIAGLVRLIADMAIHASLEYLSEMRRDMRYAWRALIKSPGFALVGIISMGLGIGLTTNVYSSKWEVLTRELPAAANASRLVMPEKPVSYYYVEQYRDQKSLFSGVAAFETGIPFNVSLQGTGGKVERIFGQLVSPDYFSVLGVKPQRGRVLEAALDKPRNAPVVVISDRFWRNHLNSSPNAVGQTLRLNGQTATIIGITPKNFNGALFLNPAELFVPITVPATLAPELANDVLHRHNAKEFLAIMCLAPGVTILSAEAALDGITRRLDKQDPSIAISTDKSRRLILVAAGTMVPVPRNLRPVIAGFFLILMSLIMAIVCMNLANMLLARCANRRKEFAIRLAVGASRFRLIRQMVSEGILSSLLGGAAGFVLAYWLSVLASQFRSPTAVPSESDFSLDWHAAVFVFVLAIVCGIGFSLGPALQATRADLNPALKEGSALQLPGYRRFGLRNVLIVAQVAGSLMLLLITGLLVMGISESSSIQTEFDPNTMYLLSLDPVRDGYSPEKAQALFEKLPEQIKRVGAVGSVALAAQPPFSIEDEEAAIQLTAEDSRRVSRVQISAFEEPVGAGYFAALSQPMLVGREFEERDQRSGANGSNAVAWPVILNESAARALFGNANAIGKRIRDDKQSYAVVGVVRDLRDGSGIAQSIAYLPFTPRDFTRPPVGGITVMVRSDAKANVMSSIRREIASIDPNLTIFNVQPLNNYLERSRSAMRFAINTYGGMGVFGLVLVAIGLAGVTAYAVAQRRREIGIRMALGARRLQVLRLVLREGAALVTIGIVIGFLGAIVIAKILSALTNMFAESLKVGADDPRLLIGAPLLLAVLAMLACYVPARRAAKVDPLTALRQE
ncbi:MAG: ABC transporter permease [Acidobacteriaceae bacterium]|nr:ABC transporter permease [Acidobacteriaceae bacterium]